MLYFSTNVNPLLLLKFQSRDDSCDGAAFFDQAHRSTKRLHFHLLMVEAELVENGGVEVAIVMRGINSFVSHLVRAAMDEAAFDSATGHP